MGTFISKRIIEIISISFLLIFTCYASGVPGGTIQFENKYLRIEIGKQHGSLIQLADLKTGHKYIAAEHDKGGIWQLELLLRGQTYLLIPKQAKTFKWNKQTGEKSILSLVWQKFGLETAPDLRVTVSIRLDERQSLSVWNIALDGLAENAIELIHFPRILHLAPLGSAERLAVPIWMGRLAKNPRELLIGSDGRTNRLEWVYPGQLSLQCLTLYQNNGPGFYATCNDTAAYRKSFVLWSSEQQDISYEMIVVPENPRLPRSSFELSYGSVIGTFSGDWTTASTIYRSWGIKQRWARESRLNKGNVPKWLLKTGLWLWNRGRSEVVLKPAALLQKELQLPVSVFWHWWHGCAYDIGFPEYLPPREGVEPFKQALDQAHDENLHAIVYMNQRLWGMTTESWQKEGAESYAVMGPDMRIRSEIYNKFTNSPCATMCLGTSFWRNKYAGLAEAAIKELGVDGIYMDQACLSLMCYNPEHGHPIGGGNYWIKGFQKLSEDIRKRCNKDEEVILAGEGGGEAWLPYLDLFLTLEASRERYAGPNNQWETIPFFQAVYHACSITYGSYSSLTEPPYEELWPAKYAPKEPLKLLDRKYRRQLYLEQARMFAWGLQPTMANFLPSQLKQRPEEIAFITRLARLRNQTLKYLLYGTFLKPPTIDVPAIDIDMLRLSIYAGQIEGQRSWKQSTPVVLTGAWQADNSHVGIALVNIYDKQVPLSFQLSAEDYNLRQGGHIYRIDESGRQYIGDYDNKQISVKLNLDGLQACIIELIEE